MNAPVSDKLRKLAREVATELVCQPAWELDALEIRDTFDAFVDAALSGAADELVLQDWLS